MAEILSQQEIDALLNAFDSGAVADTPAEDVQMHEGPKIVKPYDFRRPDKFSKNQVRTISMIMENFGRSFGTALSAKLRSLVSLQIVSIDQLTYGEFLMSISDPSVIGIFSMQPLEGHAIFEMTTPTAFYVVERLLGNRGSGSMIIRTLTEIEEVLISSVINEGLKNLQMAMASVVEVKPQLNDLENNPQFVQIVPPQDMVLLTSIEVMIGENSGMIGICLPYVVIEPILSALTTEFILTRSQSEEEGTLLASMQKTLDTVPVDLIAEVGRTDFTITNLLDLEEGDVITLPTRTYHEMNVYIDGIESPKFSARPGLKGKYNGIQITRALHQDYAGDALEAATTTVVEEPGEGSE